MNAATRRLSPRLVWSVIVALLVVAPAAWRLPSGLVAVPAAVAVLAAMARWPWPRVTIASAAGVTFALSLVADAGFHVPKAYVTFWALAEYPALLLLAARVIRRAPDRQAALLGPAAVAAIVLLPARFLFAAPTADWKAVAVACSLSIFPCAGAVGVGLYQRMLDDRRARAVRQALREQRLRVAADLHDYVAHELTGIVLETQAVRLDDDSLPEPLRQYLERMEASGLRALESMDHTVQSLRVSDEHGAGGPASAARMHGLADLPETVRRFTAASGAARCELDMPPGLAATVPHVVQDAVHRVVVEALTNVRRHAAGATWASVSVVPVAGGGVTVTVTNGGGTAGTLTASRAGGGSGLAGLRTRIEALGGTLGWGPYGTGWQVRALVAGSSSTDIRRTADVPRCERGRS
ncbi:histidine kinase [Nonomuraea sp. NPDC000554]|uniref:sensor histidine kinase n=1 Tax=Nonomuraea sp. NPDC000554 TaxID=3154259 RepID=UPI0033241BA7